MSSTNTASTITGAWVRLPLDLLKAHGVLQSDAVLLSIIIDRCGDRPSKVAALDRGKLAAAAGCSLRSVAYGLTRLEQLGLIERIRTGRQSLYRLTGAVELLPPKQRSTTQSGRTSRRSAAASADIDEYLQVVNRFASADEPLPGQMTFGGEE